MEERRRRPRQLRQPAVRRALPEEAHPGRGRRPLQWGLIIMAGSWIAMAPLRYEGGGYSFSAADNINEFGKFDPVANTWTPLAPVPDLNNAMASACMRRMSTSSSSSVVRR